MTVYDVFEINLKDGGRHSPAHSFMAQTPEILKQTPSQKIMQRKGTGFVRKEKTISESSDSLGQEAKGKLASSNSKSNGKLPPNEDKESEISSPSSFDNSENYEASQIDV